MQNNKKSLTLLYRMCFAEWRPAKCHKAHHRECRVTGPHLEKGRVAESHHHRYPKVKCHHRQKIVNTNSEGINTIQRLNKNNIVV